MNWKKVKLLFSVLDLREHLICILATITGLRPGEIFALQWRHFHNDYLDIQQRIYRGEIDTPKTRYSERKVPFQGVYVQNWSSVAVSPSTRSPMHGVPIGDSQDSCNQGQLLEATHTASIGGGRIGMGELPDHASHSRFPDAGVGCGPEGGFRSTGEHS